VPLAADERTIPLRRPRPAGVRYHDLDALRSALMFLGVFVHAALGSDKVFRAIAHASGLFRMNGFFLISGFFSTMLVLRYGPGLMLKRRLASIGVPLLATGLLCNPVACWLIYNNYNPKIGFVDFLTGHHRLAHASGPMTWHLQLWFLVSLLGYTLCVPAAFVAWRRAFRSRLVAWAAGSRLRTMTLLLTVLLTLTALDEAVYELFLRPAFGTSPVDYVVRMTLRDLPFFVLGMALFLDEQVLLDHFRRPAPILFGLGGVLVAVTTLHRGGPLATEFGGVLIRAFFALAVVANMFAAAHWLVRREYPVLRYSADAAYSVYLFHYVTIYALAALLGISVNAPWPDLLLIVALTLAVTLAVHHFLIRRFRILAMIFNGKFTIGRSPALAGLTPAAVPAVRQAPRRGRHRRALGRGPRAAAGG
jgi:glucan biosynthesis protein C